MTPSRSKTCRRFGCRRPAERTGLCREHYEEDRSRHEQQQVRRRRALDALHGTATLTTPALREELQAVRERWFVVCDVVNSERGRRDMPLEEAQYAVEWCINFAAEILDADVIMAAGGRTPITLETQREHFASRFRNLEAGLMSNGVPRGSGRDG